MPVVCAGSYERYAPPHTGWYAPGHITPYAPAHTRSLCLHGRMIAALVRIISL